MSDLLDIIARLEQAPLPDRELDFDIHCGAGFAAGRYRRRDAQGSWIEYSAHDADGKAIDLPYYTASLDAAMTLIPEGWAPAIDLYVMSDQPGGNVWRTFVRNYGRGDISTLIKFHATAPSAALSTCIAALKARAALPTTMRKGAT